MPSKRRKGKHGHSSLASDANDQAEDEIKNEIVKSAAEIPLASDQSDATRKPEDTKLGATDQQAAVDDGTSEETEFPPLVLTSEKRRGVYECDYCHTDISQLPRIRCAVCPDFDLCIDCFATTDHVSAINSFKAAANTHSELNAEGIATSGNVSLMASAAVHHDPNTHGYRVCDNTRYPLFPSTKSFVAPLSTAQSISDTAESVATSDMEKVTGSEEGNASRALFPPDPSDVDDKASTTSLTDTNLPPGKEHSTPSEDMRKEKEFDASKEESKRDSEKQDDGDKREMNESEKDEEQSKVAKTEDTKILTGDTKDATNLSEKKADGNAEEAKAGVDAVDTAHTKEEEALKDGAEGKESTNETRKTSDDTKTNQAEDMGGLKTAPVDNDDVEADDLENGDDDVSNDTDPEDKEDDETDKLIDDDVIDEENDEDFGGDEKNDDGMDVDDVVEKPATPNSMESKSASVKKDANGITPTPRQKSKRKSYTPAGEVYAVSDKESKGAWTVEEDLRLLDAIKTHGLGNWVDISERISGNGSSGKTPKKCMERYFDDFLGRYGHILPPTIYIPEDDDQTELKGTDDMNISSGDGADGGFVTALDARVESAPSTESTPQRKRMKLVPTDSLPGYDDVWPDPYVPNIEGVVLGQEVGRDQAYKAEMAFVKATQAATTKEQAEMIREEWMNTRMGQIGSPTVLPPRIEDTMSLPGAELAGFMPRRGDFDIEWDDGAEQALADMEFSPGDLPKDKELKVKILEMYCKKQDEREERKKYIIDRRLYDYKAVMKREEEMPADERDLVRRMRIFERYHTFEEHQALIADILEAKRLRKEIAKLQMYRRIGITSSAEAEKYDLDKIRRQFHKSAQVYRDADVKNRPTPSVGTPSASLQTAGVAQDPTSTSEQDEVKELLWKQYKTSDRKSRRSINRTSSDPLIKTAENDDNSQLDTSDQPKTSETKTEAISSSENATGPTLAEPAAAGDTSKAEKEPNDPTSSTAMEIVAVANEKVEEEKPQAEKFSIEGRRGYDLLSEGEVALCVQLRVYPAQYLQIKRALIHESLTADLLDKESASSSRRTLTKIDIKQDQEKGIIDFVVRAGWVSNKIPSVEAVLSPPSTGHDGDEATKPSSEATPMEVE